MAYPALWKRKVLAAVGLFALLVVPLLTVMPVKAFTVYTHAYASDSSLNDVIDDGMVTIEGREYPVNPRVVTALQQFPQFYRAGAIGPDGFPDVTYGQTVIHPEQTGAWMQYIFKAAWDAQTDTTTYPSEAERLQILAFAYGYLTHAAGDMWAHTIVNDVSLGVFPPAGEILSEADKAAIAIRHLILESYIGDATNGFDGNPDRTQVGNDVSDTSTPAVMMDAPHLWVYNTLIDPNAPTPTAGRGPIIDKFLELRASLVAELGEADPDPIQDAIDSFNDTVNAWNSLEDDCDFGADYDDAGDIAADVLHDAFWCPIGLADLGITAAVDSLQAFLNLATGAIAVAADAVKDAYIAAWIDDIDEGLLHWNELGLAITRGLFDPQARRDAQNDECWPEGGENESDRASCENGLGMSDVVLHEANDFITNHLLSMAGAPDALGTIIEIIQDLAGVFDFVSLIFDQLLNPISEAIEEIKSAVKEFVLDIVEDALGVDIEAIQSFVKHPTYWLNVTSMTIDLPGTGQTTIELFEEDTHERLDAFLGLGPDHHTGEFLPGDFESTRLKDDAVLNEEGFAPFQNLLTMERLVLLDATQLNQVMTDSLVGQGIIKSGVNVGTFPQMSTGVPTNVIFHPLTGTTPWLQNIDSDHSWRSNPLPVFCNIGSPDCDTPGLDPLPRPAADNGGNGQFPIWESCVLRPAFRDLFVDWENGGENFPDLNDVPSADPSDPNAPDATLTPTGNIFVSGGTTYVGDGHAFTLSAADTVFVDDLVSVEYRVYPDGSTPGDWQPLENGGEFSIPVDGGDGVWRVDYRSEDPCHTFMDESGTGNDPLPPGSWSTTVVLDTTGPVITIVSPLDKQVFDSDDMSAIDYTVDDGVNGSGVKSHAVTLDGKAASDGQVLDMFLIEAGTHTIAATAVDNLGNGSSLTWKFEMQATTESLISNVDRGFQEGLIKNSLIYLRARNALVMAQVPHNTGNHQLEWHRLQAFTTELTRDWKASVDPAFSARLARSANQIITQRR